MCLLISSFVTCFIIAVVLAIVGWCSWTFDKWSRRFSAFNFASFYFDAFLRAESGFVSPNFSYALHLGHVFLFFFINSIALVTQSESNRHALSTDGRMWEAIKGNRTAPKFLVEIDVRYPLFNRFSRLCHLVSKMIYLPFVLFAIDSIRLH